MVERGDCASFTFEAASAPHTVRIVFTENLDCNVPVQPRIARVHFPMPPAPSVDLISYGPSREFASRAIASPVPDFAGSCGRSCQVPDITGRLFAGAQMLANEQSVVLGARFDKRNDPVPSV